MSDDRLQTEAFQAITRGQNNLLDPSLLPQGQAARLLNVSTRNGLCETRPPFLWEDIPAQGRFQGAFAYVLENEFRWVVVISGQVWTRRDSDGTWTHVSTFPTTDFPQAYFVQAKQYCVVQNGVLEPENWPFILDGDELIDNLEVEFIYKNNLVKIKDFHPDMIDDEDNVKPDYPAPIPHAVRVPIGKAMAFGQGRLFVATERTWDNGAATGVPGSWRPAGGLRAISASDDYGWDEPERMFVFVENEFLAGGGEMSIPAENGFITSMAFFRNAVTGTGLGELVVMCRRGSTVFAVSIPRTDPTGQGNEWGQPGFGQQLFQTSGSNSPWAIQAVNSDLVYYGDNGLRTIRYTATNETSSGGMSNVPISPEVKGFTARTSAEHERFVSTTLSNNFFFFTAGSHELEDGSVAFEGVLPWDLANFQASFEPSNRVFSGAWTGHRFHAVLQLPDNRIGVIARPPEGGDMRVGILDFGLKGRDIVSAVQTPAYFFGAPRNIKRIKYADLMFDRVYTDLDVQVFWRCDSSGPWSFSDVRRFKVKHPSATGMFRVPFLPDHSSVGHVLDFVIVWKGHARLKLALFQCSVLDTFKGDPEDMCRDTPLPAGREYIEEELFSPPGAWRTLL